MTVALAALVLIANLSYSVVKIFNDMRQRRWRWAALGLVALIGINGLIFWFIYAAVTSSTDF